MGYAEDILQLAQARQLETELKTQYAPMEAKLKAVSDTIKLLDDKIRTAALKEFLEDGVKPDHDAISIHQVTRTNYVTEENLRLAFEAHPEFLTVRPDLFAAHALSITEYMHAILVLEIPGSEYISSSKQLVRELLLILDVDGKALKEAAGDGLAPWANHTSETTPTVFVSKKLGDQLFAEEPL